MDDLQFRRTVYADPGCTDEAVLKAAAEDSKKREFWDELKKLDSDLHRACKVDVPEGLAERLILRQSLNSHVKKKRRMKIHLALAASLAFVFSMSFMLLQNTPSIDIGEHSLAHVYHEGDGFALTINGDESLQTVNAKLASIGVSFSEEIGRIYFANFCNFDQVRSFHMVVEGDHGKVTVFIVPNEDNHDTGRPFSDGSMHGETLEFASARLVLVAEEGHSVTELKSRLKQRMLFSA